MSTWRVPTGTGGTLLVDRRAALTALALTLLAALSAFVVLCYGDGWSSPYDVLAALGGSGPIEFSVTQWRMPRALAGLLFGAALGLTGAIFQNLTRNPLGTPDVIGLDAGSFAGVLVVMTIGSGTASAMATGSVLGGLLAAALVYLLTVGPGFSGLRLVVIGIGVHAMLTALNSWMILRADLDIAIAATAWNAGSLNGIDWDELGLPVTVLAVLVAALVPTARAMHQHALGDDLAVTSGIRLVWLRLALIAIGVGLSSIVTSTAGPIVFIALAAPQIGRRLAGAAGVTLVPAALVGAVLLTVADLLSQVVLAPVTIPVGVVTAALGGVYLIWLLTKEVRS